MPDFAIEVDFQLQAPQRAAIPPEREARIAPVAQLIVKQAARVCDMPSRQPEVIRLSVESQRASRSQNESFEDGMIPGQSDQALEVLERIETGLTTLTLNPSSVSYWVSPSLLGSSSLRRISAKRSGTPSAMMLA